MKLLSVLLSVASVSGLVWVCPVSAEVVRAEEVEPKRHLQGAVCGTCARTLKASPLQVGTAADLIAQGMTRVTGVEIIQTESGLELVLKTVAGSKRLVPLILPVGNNLVIDILDATLALPDREAFTAIDPAEGITEVAVKPVDATSIRITIRGKKAVPNAEVVPSQDNLILSVGTKAPEREEAAQEIEVLVTAEKRPDRPQDVPISLKVVGQEELEDTQVNSLNDIANNTPNFFSSGGDRYFNFYSIRGLGNGNFLSRDSVGVFVDDVPYENALSFGAELFDIERVEVLRGPQSTLYGRSSQAGVVNIISRPPSNKPEVKVGALYGNYNQRQVQLGFSDAVIPDKLSFRLSSVYSAQDGYVEDTNGRDLNYRSGVSGRGVIRWQPTKDWDVTFTALGTGNRDGDAPYVPPDADNPFVTEPYNVEGTLDFSQNTQALKVAYDNPNLRITSITSHRFYNLTSFSDGDYTSTDLLRVDYTNKADQWTQEVRLQSPSNANRFRWILGGYLESRQTENVPEEIEYTETAAAAFGLPAAGKDITTSSLDQNTYAAFGQIDYKPVEPLTLTAGLRYEKFDNEIDRRRVFEVPGLGATPAGLELNGETSDGDIVLPKFAVEYSFNNNIATYASVTRGYKPGTLSYRAEDINLLEIRPEKSWNYEIGLKSAWLDNRVTANLALFWTQLDDYQAVLPDELGLQRNIVNANAKINGLELEVTAKPIKGLDLIAGFGYVNAEFSDYTNPFTGQDFSGNNLLYAPEYSYNLAAQYKSPGGIFGRLELQGFGKIFFDDANELSQDPYTLVNGRIGYEGKNYGVYLFANNIFDKEYQTSSFIFPPPTVISSFGDRATYGVQVRAEF